MRGKQSAIHLLQSPLAPVTDPLQSPPAPLTLVLGGARSGKSAFAEALLDDCARLLYVATAEACDEEMVQRIDVHRERRDARWTTLEAPLDIAGAIAGARAQGILVDGLTVWLANVMEARRDLDAACAHLLESLALAACPVVCVSDEVGLGTVPEHPLARAFRDRLGALNQALAARAGCVYLVVAGIPVTIKDVRADD